MRRLFVIGASVGFALSIGVVGRAVIGAGGASTVFALLRGGSGPATVDVANFCENYASIMTGSYFCQDNPFTSVGQPMSGVGSVGAPVDMLCSSGSNCASVQSAYVNNGGVAGFLRSAPNNGLTTDWIACALFSAEAVGTAKVVFAKDGLASNRVFNISVNAAAALEASVYKSNVSGTTISGGTVTAAAWHIGCLTYDFVTDGTSIERLYLDGSQVAVSTTAVGPAQNVGQYYEVGTNGSGSNLFTGRVAVSFATETLLDATSVAAISSALLPPIQGSRGETITTTRSSVRECCGAGSSNSGCSLLPTNRACVSASSLSVSGAATNLVSNPEALDLWTPTNATVTSLTQDWPSARGTMTAEQVNATSIGGYVESASFVITGTVGTASIFAALNGTKVGLLVLRDTTAGVDRCSVRTYGAQGWWQRFGCTSTAIVSGNNHVLRWYPGGTASNGPCFGWGAMATATNYLTPYCTTSCNAETHSITNPLPSGQTQWCIGADVDRSAGLWNAAAVVANLGPTLDASNSASLSVDASGGATFKVVDNAAGTKQVAVAASTLKAGGHRLVGCDNAGTLTLYVDGVSSGSVTGAGTGVVTTMPGTVTIGSASSANYLNGGVRNFCISNKANGCYGSRPSSQLGSWAALGDSITDGLGNIPYAAVALRGFNSGYLMNNRGVTGWTATDIATEWTNNVRGKGYSHLTLLGGINGIRNNGDTGAATFTTLQTIVDQARTDGMRVVWINVLPFGADPGWTSGKQTQVEALNALIASYCTTNADSIRCVDAYTAMGDPNNPQRMNPSYDSGDGLHPNQAGHNRLGALLSGVLSY